ncbi:ATP-binding protein [Tranquillimonas alkanivorans]|uniref:histidine kinase n=1 Tax=Tranquillimonas alkanivorans TaxID=441119 RepID=A0A1I5NTT2_9RHOB|nr:ATP-binding protein [Tranquillimonas alkanivorans]SFP25040.1 two-component system, cell cycle sensor histidine kinase and response regulator CckA [Tranquillimonas alkanivorans]
MQRPALADLRLSASAALLWAAMAAAALIVALARPEPPAQAAPVAFAAVAALFLVVTLLRGLLRQSDARRLVDTVAILATRDPVPVLLCDTKGHVIYRNRAAAKGLGARRGEPLSRVLGARLAAPAEVVLRLKTVAEDDGEARETVALRRGRVRLAAHAVAANHLLWRIEDAPDRAPPHPGEALAVPMLLADEGGAVLFRNAALREIEVGAAQALEDLLGTRAADGFVTLGAGEHALPTRPVEVPSRDGRREVYFLPPDVLPEAHRDDLFDALPVALIRLSRTGTLRQANRLARELLRIESVEDQPLSDLVEGLGRPVSEWVADCARSGRLRSSEVGRACRAPDDRFVQLTLGAQPRAGGDFVAVLHDATELKTLEAQFVQSQKMQAIGQLAGGVAHDFNNLLTAISGHCDLLLLRHDESDPDYPDLEQINQNANRAASLVGQLLAFSRKQNLRPELLDMREALADLTHLLNRLVGEKVSLTFRHDPNLQHVRADKRQLEQVIMNLVVNARDAMPEGGAIMIETVMKQLDSPLQRDRAKVPPGEYVLVRVTDEGEGIPPESLPKIFEPFFTTKAAGEGTGLGLSTAYGIVKQTGGFIFADSPPGEGTTFTLYFPAHARPAEASVGRSPAAIRAARAGGATVLLVEDEAPVRAFAARALCMRGFDVMEAGDGEEALELLEDPELEVDVFVTDVIMPGLDGPGWVRRALEDRPEARVVFMSGYAEESFADQQARIPNSVFLPKPFSLQDLVATVRNQTG